MGRFGQFSARTDDEGYEHRGGAEESATHFYAAGCGGWDASIRPVCGKMGGTTPVIPHPYLWRRPPSTPAASVGGAEPFVLSDWEYPGAKSLAKIEGGSTEAKQFEETIRAAFVLDSLPDWKLRQFGWKRRVPIGIRRKSANGQRGFLVT